MSQGLKKLQEQFWAKLQTGSSELKNEIETTDNLNAEDRLRVYSNAYVWRLEECLVDDFSLLHEILGCQTFDTLTREYILKHPSQYYSLDYFGKDFPIFLRNHPLSKEHPWIFDLARFEWAQAILYVAPDEKILKISQLQTFSPEEWPQKIFRVINNIHILKTKYQIEDISQKDTENTNTLIVWRKGEEIFYRRLKVNETYLLSLLKENIPFGAVCEKYSTQSQNAQQEIFEILNQFINDELIIA